MYDLSILIPSRNEMFLQKTIENILENSEANTEIIVTLDGAWNDPSVDPGIKDDDRVTLIYLPQAVGQRAATNIACKLSKAKYVMKCDAHCAFDKGFDRKMLEAFKEVGDDVTMVPVMLNLHAFDWVCEDGHRRYQSPSGPCHECGKETTRDVIFKPRSRTPHSTAFRFDTNMHFQYFNEFKKNQVGELVETPSIQGSCFMLTREKYWELDICDESWPGWGQQGVEVSLKTWLSGGRVLCNTRTWYAHMFRTQGGDFSFPWGGPRNNMDEMRQMTKDLFTQDKWPKATKTFQWYLDKFKPLPGWHDNHKDRDIGDMENYEIPDADRKGIIYYTDNQLKLKVAHAVQNQLKSIGLPIVSASLKPMTFGDKNVVIDGKRGYETYFRQIIAALETLQTEIVFFCEHDVLYHPSHFDFTPTDKETFYYDLNVVRWKYPEDLAVSWDAHQVAQLVCYRETALKWYQKKLKEYLEAPLKTDDKNRQMGDRQWDRKFEPEDKFEDFRSKEPSIDIRHHSNLTKSKWSLDDFRDKSTAKNFKQVTVPEWARNIL